MKLELTVIKFPAVTQNINQQLTGSLEVVRSCRIFCLRQEIFKNTCLRFHTIMETAPCTHVDDK